MTSDAAGKVPVIERPILARYIIEAILGQLTSQVLPLGGNEYLVTLENRRYQGEALRFNRLGELDLSVAGLGRITTTVEE